MSLVGEGSVLPVTAAPPATSAIRLPSGEIRKALTVSRGTWATDTAMAAWDSGANTLNPSAAALFAIAHSSWVRE